MAYFSFIYSTFLKKELFIFKIRSSHRLRGQEKINLNNSLKEKTVYIFDLVAFEHIFTFRIIKMIKFFEIYIFNLLK